MASTSEKTFAPPSLLAASLVDRSSNRGRLSRETNSRPAGRRRRRRQLARTRPMMSQQVLFAFASASGAARSFRGQEETRRANRSLEFPKSQHQMWIRPIDRLCDQLGPIGVVFVACFRPPSKWSKRRLTISKLRKLVSFRPIPFSSVLFCSVSFQPAHLGPS